MSADLTPELEMALAGAQMSASFMSWIAHASAADLARLSIVVGGSVGLFSERSFGARTVTLAFNQFSTLDAPDANEHVATILRDGEQVYVLPFRLFAGMESLNVHFDLGLAPVT